ncbi:MAG: acyl-CoA dehydrogenase family protein [Nocardioides sp.]|uniref:acyl-CoA dehydrogenase family protein n=1 Tax=Nocardioides sp. TaxID=35761 RepID=UPI0039E44E9A
MHFGVTQEQRSFAEALDDLLSGTDVPAAARAWAAGEHESGLALWRRLAELGVTGLAVPEELGGLEASKADLTVAFEALGRHAVPGPWIESIALAPRLLAGAGLDTVLEGVAEGTTLVTVAATVPRALDADVADELFVLDGTMLSRAELGAARTSVDPARRLYDVRPGAYVATLDRVAVDRALDGASLAAAATVLGAGERLLAESVSYATTRRQFGQLIGEYQALKHLLADVRVALDFARPLVHLAALGLDAGVPEAGRDVSAAAVACAEAARLAARTALQVHGAIGYTQECDLSLWLLKVRALRTAWGTPDHHRRRVLASLTGPTSARN